MYENTNRMVKSTNKQININVLYVKRNMEVKESRLIYGECMEVVLIINAGEIQEI